MLEELRYAQAHWSEEVSIGRLMLTYTPDMVKAYPPFVNFFENTKEMLQSCDRENPRYNRRYRSSPIKVTCAVYFKNVHKSVHRSVHASFTHTTVAQRTKYVCPTVIWLTRSMAFYKKNNLPVLRGVFSRVILQAVGYFLIERKMIEPSLFITP